MPEDYWNCSLSIIVKQSFLPPEFIVWHDGSKPELWKRKIHPLLGSGNLNSRPLLGNDSVNTSPWQRICTRNNRRSHPHGGGFKYLHCSHACHRRWWKGNPLSGGGYNWATLFQGDINTGTWPSRLGESRIWDNKIWSWVPRNSNPRMTVLAKASSNCRWQTHPLDREGALHQLTHSCVTVTKIWSWAPNGTWHKDRLAT
jgi:hypothetical protein